MFVVNCALCQNKILKSHLMHLFFNTTLSYISVAVPASIYVCLSFKFQYFCLKIFQQRHAKQRDNFGVFSHTSGLFPCSLRKHLSHATHSGIYINQPEKFCHLIRRFNLFILVPIFGVTSVIFILCFFPGPIAPSLPPPLSPPHMQSGPATFCSIFFTSASLLVLKKTYLGLYFSISNHSSS